MEPLGGETLAVFSGARRGVLRGARNGCLLGGMRARFLLAVGLLGAAPIALVGIACSGGGSGSDAGPDGTTDTGTPDTGGGGDASDSGTKDSGSNPCNTGDGGVACRQCCANAHSQGYLAFLGSLAVCTCLGNDGGTFCSSCVGNMCAAEAGAPTMACSTCAFATLAPDGGPCVGYTQQYCATKPDCVAFFACANSCP